MTPHRAIRQTPPQVITAIDELLDRHTHAEIADILNQRGLELAADLILTSIVLTAMVHSRRTAE